MTSDELRELVAALTTEVRILAVKVETQSAHIESLTESNKRLSSAFHEHEKKFAFSEGKSMVFSGVIGAMAGFLGHVFKSIVER